MRFCMYRTCVNSLSKHAWRVIKWGSISSFLSELYLHSLYVCTGSEDLGETAEMRRRL